MSSPVNMNSPIPATIQQSGAAEAEAAAQTTKQISGNNLNSNSSHIVDSVSHVAGASQDTAANRITEIKPLPQVSMLATTNAIECIMGQDPILSPANLSQSSLDELAVFARFKSPLHAAQGNALDTAIINMFQAEKLSPMMLSAPAILTGSSVAVQELNLTPTVLTPLCSGNVTFSQINRAREEKSGLRRRRKSQQEHGEKDAEFEQEDDVSPDKNTNDDTGQNEQDVEGVVELMPSSDDSALFEPILHALIVSKQRSLLRQLDRSRRILLVFPEDPGLHDDAAEAYVLWRNADGTKQLISLSAHLTWKNWPLVSEWVVFGTYKDRSPYAGWQLRVQHTRPGRHELAIVLGGKVELPMDATRLWVKIPDAGRFWAALGAQFSINIAVSSVPLDHVGYL